MFDPCRVHPVGSPAAEPEVSVYISTRCAELLLVHVSVGTPSAKVVWLVESSSVSALTSCPFAAVSVPTPWLVASW